MTGDHTNDLDAALNFAHEALAEAAGNRGSPGRLVSFATIGLDGTPQARTVMLRTFSAARWEMSVHTDARTPKVEELRRTSAAQCLFWDQARALQLRLSGPVSVHTDDEIARAAWSGVDLVGSFSYLTDRPPGLETPVPTSGREGMDGRVPTPEEAAGGWDNFAVLAMKLREIDWVLLDDAGHRRARYSFGDRGLTSARWLIP